MRKLVLDIDIDDRSDVKKIMDALKMFKGVKRVSLERDILYPQLDRALEEVHSGEVVRVKTVAELRQSLDS